jgi:hypothetical protein
MSFAQAVLQMCQAAVQGLLHQLVPPAIPFGIPYAELAEETDNEDGIEVAEVAEESSSEEEGSDKAPLLETSKK